MTGVPDTPVILACTGKIEMRAISPVAAGVWRSNLIQARIASVGMSTAISMRTAKRPKLVGPSTCARFGPEEGGLRNESVTAFLAFYRSLISIQPQVRRLHDQHTMTP